MSADSFPPWYCTPRAAWNPMAESAFAAALSPRFPFSRCDLPTAIPRHVRLSLFPIERRDWFRLVAQMFLVP